MSEITTEHPIKAHVDLYRRDPDAGPKRLSIRALDNPDASICLIE